MRTHDLTPFGRRVVDHLARLSSPTLTELGALTGLAPSTLHRAIRGTPDPATVRSIVDALELDDASRPLWFALAFDHPRHVPQEKTP